MKKNMDYELKPQYYNAKSFYGKAKVYNNEKGEIFLKSYETTVAEISEGKLIIYDWYSATTSKHINEFAQQHGFSKKSKKEMLEGR